MFVKQKNYDNCIQKVRINVGTLVGLESEEEAHLTLKELPTDEVMALREATKGGDVSTIEFFKNVIPKILVDHDFYESESKKMTNEAVRDLIFEKIELATKVMNDYSNASFFTQQKKNGNK